VAADLGHVGPVRTPRPVLELPSGGINEGGLPAQGGVVRGEASWYRDPNSPGGLYGAVHSYRFGDPRYSVRVCRADNDDVCVTVTVRDHMANAVRAIDLSPTAFARLAPLSRGVVQVTVSRAPRIELPATDTAP